MSVKQSIKVTNAGLSPILSVAQGTGAIEYEFTVSDFDIPSGSAAVAYNIQPTGNIVSQTCSISGNTITVKPPAYYFLRGKNYMQFQVSRSNKDLFSFLIEVWCAPNISQPEVIVAENPSLVSQLISDVGLLSSQLDNLLSIPSGSLSTSADAALADIKVGWDGTTYDTPGDAVRGQADDLNTALIKLVAIYKNIAYEYETKDDIQSEQFIEMNGSGVFKTLGSDISTYYFNLEVGKKYTLVAKAELVGDINGNVTVGVRTISTGNIFQGSAYQNVTDAGTYFLQSTFTATSNNKTALQIFASNTTQTGKVTYKSIGIIEGEYVLEEEIIDEDVNVSLYTEPLQNEKTEQEITSVEERVTSVEERVTDMESKKHIVHCFGDSLTAGAGGNGTSYPSVLQTLLGDEYEVINYGTGGESGDTIGCRMGALLAYIKEDTTFTKNVPTELEAYDVYGQRLKIRSSNYNNVYINGIKGTITYNTSDDYNKFSAEETFAAKAGTPVLVTQSTNDADITIVCMGQNGVAGVNVNPQKIDGNEKSNDEIWCDVGKIMQGYTNGTFIFLGLPTAGSSSYDNTVDKTGKEYFGGAYICSRHELSAYGLEIVGLTPTDEDNEAIQNGMCPPSLMSDTVHMNSNGYTAWANIIYRHLLGLNLTTNS